MSASKSIVALFLCAAALATTACATDEDLDVAAGPGAEAEAEAAPVDLVAWKGIPRPEIAEILHAHPEALQIAEDQVAFDGGNVVLTIPGETGVRRELALSSSVHGCPRGWFCFYDAYNFGGRKLQFRDCSNNGTTQSLANYGFANFTTSWVVNRSVDAIGVDHQVSANGYIQLWMEYSYTSSSNVGTANNDKADSFTCWL
jgi:hypothetical protein